MKTLLLIISGLGFIVFLIAVVGSVLEAPTLEEEGQPVKPEKQ